MDLPMFWFIEKNSDAILEELDVTDVLDTLLAEGVISSNDYEGLKCWKDEPRRNKCIRFLNILRSKDNDSCNKFIAALKKDYKWLCDKIIPTNDPVSTRSSLDENIELETLVLGNFPKLPEYYVERTNELYDLRKKLLDLLPQQTLIVHGMVLIGKSCLVAAALRNKLLLDQAFQNKVFWVNLGEVHDMCNDKDKLIYEMYRLYLNMGGSQELNMLSENEDEDLKILELQVKLKKIITSQTYSKMLLVLDNLRGEGIYEYFDIGCKVLITTSDLNLVKKHNNMEVIKVHKGFTTTETLLLIGRCLGRSPEELPQYIKEVSSLCRGHPMLTALIASFLEDQGECALTDESFGQYILTQYNMFGLDGKISKAISLCIDNLKTHHCEYYEYFKSLVIFPEDVNITSTVLEILWNKNKWEVHYIMKQLEKRSLVMCFFNKTLAINVYGIHHVLLSSLRSTMDIKETDKWHKVITDRCEEIILGGDLGILRNDNYILHYYGFHLCKAKLFKKFSIFFDLDFISAKIRIVSCADILRDFQIYHEHITNGEWCLQQKIKDYEYFIKEYGYLLRRYQFIDIVQCGLQQSADSNIFKAAKVIAEDNPKKLYFKLQYSHDKHYFTHILKLPYEVTTACFTNDINHVLVASVGGEIIMWEQVYQKELHRFIGHTDKVICLKLSPAGTHFLSVSEDGTVKLWDLQKSTPRNSLQITSDKLEIGKNIPSPYLKQQSYQYYYDSYDQMKNNCLLTYKCEEIDDQYVSIAFAHNCSNTHLIAKGSKRGKVVISDYALKETRLEIPPRGNPATCITFSPDDTAIIFNSMNNILIYCASSGDYLRQMGNQSEINFIISLPEINNQMRLIAGSNKYLTLWKMDSRETQYERCCFAPIQVDNVCYTCATCTKDSCFLVVGSTDSYLRTFTLESLPAECIIEKYNEGKVICLDTFQANDDEVHVLLIGSENKTIKQWHIHDTVKSALHLPIFSVHWSPSSEVPKIAIANPCKMIQIFAGYKLFSETEQLEADVTEICFATDGNKIAYSLKNGKIFEFDYKVRKTQHIISMEATVKFLKYFKQDSSLFGLSSDILVASAENGRLIIHQNEKLITLEEGSTDGLSSNHTKQCFYFCDSRRLLTVSQNRAIILWELHGDSHLLLRGKGDNVSVTSVLSPNENKLLCISERKGFEIYHLEMNKPNARIDLYDTKPLQGVSCGSFSFDEKLLAFGKYNGSIEIWDSNNRSIIATLDVHQSSITDLVFSAKPDYVLVSLSEQMVWWNISEYFRSNTTHNMSKLALRRNLSKQLSNVHLSIWNNKESHNSCKGLLSAIKLLGDRAFKICASPTFMTFLTVDNVGKLYILEVIDNVMSTQE